MFKIFFKNNKIEIAKQAIEKDPQNILKLSILADLYLDGNFFSEAINILERILRIDEKYLPALDKLGMLYFKSKQYLKAYRTLKYLYELEPNNFAIKTRLFLLKDVSCDNEAKVEILKGLLAFEENVEVTELLAQTYLDCGQFIKSADLYENLYINDEKTDYLINLANIYYQLKKWKKVTFILEKLMLSDSFTIAHSEMLAEAYNQTHNYDEAIGIYEFLINNNSKQKEFYRNKIAQIHLAQNDPDKALEATNSSIQENAYAIDAKFITVQAYIDKKEYSKAIEYLQEFYFDPISKDIENKVIAKIIEVSIIYSQQLRNEKKYTDAIDILVTALRYNEYSRDIYLELAEISNDIKDYSSANEYKKIAASYENNL